MNQTLTRRTYADRLESLLTVGPVIIGAESHLRAFLPHVDPSDISQIFAAAQKRETGFFAVPGVFEKNVVHGLTVDCAISGVITINYQYTHRYQATTTSPSVPTDVMKRQAVQFAHEHWGQALRSPAHKGTYRVELVNPLILDPNRRPTRERSMVVALNRDLQTGGNGNSPRFEQEDEHFCFATERLIEAHEIGLHGKWYSVVLCAACGSGFTQSHCPGCDVSFNAQNLGQGSPLVAIGNELERYLVSSGHVFVRSPELARARVRTAWENATRPPQPATV